MKTYPIATAGAWKTLRMLVLLIAGIQLSVNAQTKPMQANKILVEQGFGKWSKGTANFFDLLADNVVWTITGNSPIAKTYTSRAQFLREAIDPLNRRLAKKIVPVEWVAYAEGDVVVALWSGQATAKDGQPYNNTYAWFMTFRGGKIVKVTAFFDSIELAELWKRVPEGD